MNVLITGAAGFLGSHLADAYVAAGHAVTGVDNLVTSDGSNLEHLRGEPNFQFELADVSQGLPESISRPDLILHFASPASPIDYADLPLQTLAVNARGTEHCCEAARRAKARLVFASTSEIYGDPLVHPQPESYWGNVNSFGPRSCYDEGKRYGEAVVATYRRMYGVDARAVRIFNTYGPRMRAHDGRVVPAFIMQALEGRPLTVFGDGNQTRSLCYVADLVEGIRRFAALDSPVYPVVNLGSDGETTVNEIAESIARLSGVPLVRAYRPLPADDPSRRRPDLSRAHEMLGWSANVPLETGMRDTIDWFRSHVPLQKETALP
jgi:dTDP-glucose 4,6-dehydratase